MHILARCPTFPMELTLLYAIAACVPSADPMDSEADAGAVVMDAGFTPNADAGQGSGTDPTDGEVDAGNDVVVDAGLAPETDAGIGADEEPTEAMLRNLAAQMAAWLGVCFEEGGRDQAMMALEPIYYEALMEGFRGQLIEESVYILLQAEAANPRKRFQRNAYDTCLSLIQSTSCMGGFMNIPEAINDACGAVFSGQQGDGSVCAQDDECAGYLDDDSFCELPSEGTCGTCRPRLEEGATCERTESCESGYECDFLTSTCTAIPGAGEACSFSCAPGYECGGEGTCVTPPSEGDDCTPSLDTCGGLFAGLVCDDATSRCVAIVPVDVGETCDNGARHCINSFTVNVCSQSSFGEPGECQARPGLDEPCPDAVCTEGLVCDYLGTASCVEKPGAGSPCVAGLCDDDAICDDSDQCVVLPGEGEACIRGVCGVGLECSEESVCAANGEVDVCATR